MTKQEALIALAEGKHLTHRYFSPHEYVYQEGHKIYMEDGASIESYIFWSDRRGIYWETDWEIYKLGA